MRRPDELRIGPAYDMKWRARQDSNLPPPAPEGWSVFGVGWLGLWIGFVYRVIGGVGSSRGSGELGRFSGFSSCVSQVLQKGDVFLALFSASPSSGGGGGCTSTKGFVFYATTLSRWTFFCSRQ